MDIIKILSKELNIKEQKLEATIQLIDEGNTIPFIARYRKEVTGSLDDEVLRNLDERLKYLRNLEERKAQVSESIRSQGVEDEELYKKIDMALTLVEVEDLYRPYKPKRMTRAIIAVNKGLDPLAKLIYEQSETLNIEEEAKKYISDAEGLEVEDEAAAIAGALDIIAEQISDDAQYRSRIRKDTFEYGSLTSVAKDEEESSVYENYYNYSELVKKCVSHRVLAINRGEKEKILTVKIEAPQEEILKFLESRIIKNTNKKASELLRETIADSYKRLIKDSIEREIRSELNEKAEEEAIKVFSKNLEQLLMQAPITGRVVLGWDPAFRTGCKLAIVDETGRVLDTTVIYPTAPQNKVKESKEILKKLISKYNVSLISVGNGTASRESESIIAELIGELDKKVEYVIVNEAGASVYSASKLATEEFPNFDVGQRSAASIARRLQDPLAELVKIDPKSIGVGQYQHDMNQKHLSESLSTVVEDCVNKVGVDLNTASASLLEYISGISKTVAKNIVLYREENGSFKNRKELLKVPKLGPKAYEQCAGFLRIYSGSESLDITGVHPESYKAAKKLIELLDFNVEEITSGGIKNIQNKVDDYKSLAEEIGVGEPTLRDIVKELEKPARDPRDEMPKPILRTDVLDINDIKEDMILKGTVRNVIDFGVFVDIGVHQDGLVHISQLSKSYIKHPLDVVSVGDIVEVKVLSVDTKKNRIALSMIL
jgi:tex-like protein protein-like protein